MDGGQQHCHHAGVFGIVFSLWRGGGRLGQCLHRRHRQQRDQGMGGGQQHRHHAGVFGIVYPSGVAVDGSGNVYIADTGNNAIKEWVAANNTVTTLVSSGLNRPCGVAVDGAGNVYIADTVQQRDQGMGGGQQHRHHTGVFGIISSLWRGGGRLGQCLHRRHRQQRDQGMVGSQQHRHHAGVFGIISIPLAWRWTARAMSTSPTPATTRSKNCLVPSWIPQPKRNRHQAAAIRCRWCCPPRPT